MTDITTLTLTDATVWPDTQLDQLRIAVLTEQERRTNLVSIPAQVDSANRTYLAAAGVKDGDPWRQPVGAFDAYPKDYTATLNGKTWVSLVPGNVWQPGVSSWREQVAAGYPAWAQPTGATDAYNTGERVTFQGAVYESTINANTWSPTGYPAGWKIVP